MFFALTIGVGVAQARPLHHHRPAASTGAFQFSSTDPGSSLLAEARRYLGTNPTGWRSDWCAHFLDLILRKTGHPGGGNLARGYAHYGHRISGPRVGAIAVFARRGRARGGSPGGHVGVVAGVDPNGNPIVISGNHNHAVEQSVYPRNKVMAYVEPN